MFCVFGVGGKQASVSQLSIVPVGVNLQKPKKGPVEIRTPITKESVSQIAAIPVGG